MLEHQDYIINNAINGKNVDTIYLDFTKAFDKVDHGVLLHKVRTLGIRQHYKDSQTNDWLGAGNI